MSFLLLKGISPIQAQVVVYKSIPSPLPGNVVSAGEEAYGFNELGDGLVLTPGTGRVLTSVKVIMSSFACTSGVWSDPVPVLPTQSAPPSIIPSR